MSAEDSLGSASAAPVLEPEFDCRQSGDISTTIRFTYMNPAGELHHSFWQTTEHLDHIALRMQGPDSPMRQAWAALGCEILTVQLVLESEIPADLPATEHGELESNVVPIRGRVRLFGCSAVSLFGYQAVDVFGYLPV